MITLSVSLTFDQHDVANATAWWKQNGFSPDTTIEHVLIQAALNGIGSPDYDHVERTKGPYEE